MNLSALYDLLALAQTRHELGHVIGSIDRGDPIIISSLESEGHMLVPADKLPAGFENALRALGEELDTQIKGMGVDPDMPLIPEVEIDGDDSEDDEQ